jgi:glycosyltransferase involved in cell wall biosynthesis
MKTIESTRRIRVLHIVGGMNRGGIETWLMHVLRCIDHKQFQMDFIVHTVEPCAYDDEIRDLGGRIIPCLRYNRPWSYAKNFRRILGVYGPFDIVHSHVRHYSGYTLLLAQHAGIPVRIAHSHDDASPSDRSPNLMRRVYLSIADRWISRYATIRLAASGRAAEAMFGPAWRSGSLCKLLYYGIDLDPFRAHRDRSLRATLRLPLDAFVIGHVGRFVEQKNHRFLLEIVQRVADVDPKTRLLLIGDGPLRATIERRAAELGIAERVVFAGLRSDVPRLLLSAVDVFVMPSLHEGLGLALLEAQAAGLPCIVADSVPNEAEVIPQLVTRLQLSQSASSWARFVFASRNYASPITQDKALAAMKASPFSIGRATAELTQLYETAVASTSVRSPDSFRLAGGARSF